MKVIDPISGRPNRRYSSIIFHKYYLNYGYDWGSFKFGYTFDWTDKRCGKILWYITFYFMFFNFGLQRITEK